MDKKKEDIKDKRCAGCRHADGAEGDGWCYMFREKPETLPCGQHDKFKAGRDAMARMIRKNPLILSWVMEQNEEKDK